MTENYASIDNTKAALNMIQDWGVPIKKVKFLAILSSQKGLEYVQSEFPELEVRTLICIYVLTESFLNYF